MISFSDYYKEKMYPLQNGVLNIVQKCGMPFYLTGGTALSRAYYNHRYSDDLDFFVNNDKNFVQNTKLILKALKDNNYSFQENEIIITPDFISLYINESQNDNKLKIDFVNDITPHFGSVEQTDLFFRTDCIQNILSNKLSAIYRFAAKDIADIHEICLNHSFSWSETIKQAQQKEANFDITDATQIINGLPEEEFSKIRWIKKYDYKDFMTDIKNISKDMISGQVNNLCINKKEIKSDIKRKNKNYGLSW